MTKTLVALAAAASIGAAALAVPSPAQAGGCFGCAVGAGIAGGFIAGAIIGSAAAAPPPYYYGPAPAYYGPGPGCYYTRQPVWDPYWGGYRPGPRVLVCP